MKDFLLNILLCFSVCNVYAQDSYGVRAKVLDYENQAPLQNVVISTDNSILSVETNSDGFFEWELPHGKHQIHLRHSDFMSKTISIEIVENQWLDLGDIYLQEDITTESQLSLIVLTENDLEDGNTGSETTSGLLQATKDPFHQAAAFNWGQSRFRIRGVGNEYGNIFINGILMNKFYDGKPQFSNWGGLNDAVRNQEFTPGSRPMEYTSSGILGSQSMHMRASSLQPGTRISFSGANTNYNWRTMLTHSTGYNKKGWALAFSTSYRLANEAFFEGTDYDAKSLFFAVEKKLSDNHTLNFSAIYANNKRGKNSPNTQEVIDLMGYKYNSYWGWQDGKKRNSRDKDIEEPLFILSHYWDIDENTHLQTNVAYQFGKISNSRIDFRGANNPDPTYYKNLPSYYLNYHTNNNGNLVWSPDYYKAELNKIDFLQNAQISWNRMYASNLKMERSVYALSADVMQDKQWTANTFFTKYWKDKFFLNTGITYRRLYSENYQEMLDLLGGNYMLDVDPFYTDDFAQSDINQLNREIRKGDKYRYHYALDAQAIDFFTQFKVQLSKGHYYFSPFVNYTTYQRTGHYRNGLYKDHSFGKGKTLVFENFGIKTGGQYQISPRHYLESNISFYTQAPSIRNAYMNIRFTDASTKNLQLEKIFSSDISYIARLSKLKGRISGYYNKVKDVSKVNFYYAEGVGFEDFEQSNVFVSEITTGIEQTSYGIEIGLEHQLSKTIKLLVAAGLGQSIYSNDANVGLNIDKRAESGLDTFVDFGKAYIRNYRVGGIPQKAYSLGLEYRNPKYWWIGANANVITDFYIDISPLLRTNNFFAEPGQNGASFPEVNEATAKKILKQEKLNNVFLVNIQGGKSWKIKKNTIGCFASVNNLLDLVYKVGGFEQTRNANYRELLADHASGTRSFGPKYFYGFGRTYFVNLYVQF